MTIHMISFTRAGAALCARLCGLMKGHEVRGFAPGRYSGEFGLSALAVPVGEWAGGRFNTGEALVFIGAAGIALRAIAPYISSKERDPAVLCLDEDARFVVPLLSGHTGGGAELAEKIAALLGALPVLTAATDVRERFAIDSWARKNNCAVADHTRIKFISAAILEGQTVGLHSDFPLIGELPEGLARTDSAGSGVLISLQYKNLYPESTLWIIPRCLRLGIGCRKNVEAEVLSRQVLEALRRYNLPLRAVREVATIDRKEEEPALLAFCGELGLTPLIYSAAELGEVRGSAASSQFVLEKVGVDNVCERAALAGGGRLLVPKTGGEGITVAAALLDWSGSF